MTDSAELVPSTEPIHEPVPIPATTLEILTRSELDTMILAARKFPRSMALARQNALGMIREDVQTASQVFYTLFRRGPDGTMIPIEGPSIRCAEIVKSCWGNLRSGGRLLEVRKSEVVAQGFAHDLQTNTWDVREVMRRIERSDGRRYSDDMITVTANAAIAIAERNAIFNVIPRTFIDPLWQAAKKVVAGSIKTLGESRKRAMIAVEDLHVPVARVLAVFGRAGIDDLTVDDLVSLHGMLNALRDGRAPLDEIFPFHDMPATASSPTEQLRETVRRRRGVETPPEDVSTPPIPPEPDTPR